VGHVRARARVVRLLRLPGHETVLDVNLPRTRAGAVDAVRGADDLVVLPALPVGILPAAALVGGDAVTARKLGFLATEEGQLVQEMTHIRAPGNLPCRVR